MKKQLVFLLIVLAILTLSSCGKCKHKNYSENVVSPNCYTEGYVEHTCTKCGDSYKDNIQPKTKHHFTGAACPNCGMAEITENITPDTEWHSEGIAMFTLTTKEQLAGFASLVNSGTDFTNKIVYLGADIDLGYYEWIPIGNAEHAYNGSFDGNGHTVSGLKINAAADYVGLFGNSTGKIININVIDANVFVGRDYNYVAIICGCTTNEITNVSANGFIEAPKSDYVGAIAGGAKPGDMLYSKLTNSAVVRGKNFVGGIIGDITSTGIVQTDRITNSGDVTGESQVGGVFGHINAKVGSSVYNVNSSADIVGDYYVGGIIGKADNVAVSTCSNEGSTVTANSYCPDGSEFRAWLGGYVGYGYSIEKCTNNVNITYNSRGTYVGGIIGYATNSVKDCTNNGTITTYTNYVGGIAGLLCPGNTYGELYKNLANNGNITGKDYVGGVVGAVNQNMSVGSDVITKFDKISNSARVEGEKNVGGLIGMMYTENDGHYGYSYYRSYFDIIESKNVGTVFGINNCGELFGKVTSEGTSTVTGYTVTGKITINGELLEGEYDVGSNTKFVLSGREVYGAESTDATE